MIVMKFGGSSLSSREKILKCIDCIQKQQGNEPFVVLSAMGKTTNMLIESARNARLGKVDVSGIEKFHMDIMDELELDSVIIEQLIYQLSTLLHGVSLVKELTDRTMDHIMSFGERMSIRIFAAAMTACGTPAAAVNSYDLGLVTDSEHTKAVPCEGIGDNIRAACKKINSVIVTTGFLGKDKNGAITTLGRSGSDYSASIFGAHLKAAEVQIWTDVDGVMTCDPSLSKDAENLPVLSFDEASELAYYGAEVLHPSTLVPAIKNEIPVRVLNTMNPQSPGTKIVADKVITDRMAKAVVYKEDVCLVHIASPRLMSSVKILSNSYEILSALKIRVHMATTSEATVSFVTDVKYDKELLMSSIKELEKLGKVEVEKDKAIICVVGQELKGQAGVLGKIFTAVSQKGIKAKMVSQSASEINVAFVVNNDEIRAAVHALHDLIIN